MGSFAGITQESIINSACDDAASISRHLNIISRLKTIIDLARESFTLATESARGFEDPEDQMSPRGETFNILLSSRGTAIMKAILRPAASIVVQTVYRFRGQNSAPLTRDESISFFPPRRYCQNTTLSDFCASICRPLNGKPYSYRQLSDDVICRTLKSICKSHILFKEPSFAVSYIIYTREPSR